MHHNIKCTRRKYKKDEKNTVYKAETGLEREQEEEQGDSLRNRRLVRGTVTSTRAGN
jgi:hypothetical protein